MFMCLQCLSQDCIVIINHTLFKLLWNFCYNLLLVSPTLQLFAYFQVCYCSESSHTYYGKLHILHGLVKETTSATIQMLHSSVIQCPFSWYTRFNTHKSKFYAVMRFHFMYYWHALLTTSLMQQCKSNGVLQPIL
jgi:hypothetical protein